VRGSLSRHTARPRILARALNYELLATCRSNAPTYANAPMPDQSVTIRLGSLRLCTILGKS